MERTILLVGAGRMAMEYASVLKGGAYSIITVGRGEESARVFTSETGLEVITGGLKSFLSTSRRVISHAFVAVNVTELSKVCMQLLDYGIKNILLEKPGAVYHEEIEELLSSAEECGSKVYLAYNRRFLASVRRAKEILESDGGVRSFQFEFTEISDKIAVLKKHPDEKERWFLSNSSHIADLAFYLGGLPVELNALSTGEFPGIPSGSNFAGSGRTANGSLFSYSANWDAPGRWGVELMSKNYRLILRPVEKLQIQERGSFAIEEAEIDDKEDREFKPGLRAMVRSFLEGEGTGLCTLEDQLRAFPYYYRIANYS